MPMPTSYSAFTHPFRTLPNLLERFIKIESRQNEEGNPALEAPGLAPHDQAPHGVRQGCAMCPWKGHTRRAPGWCVFRSGIPAECQGRHAFGGCILSR